MSVKLVVTVRAAHLEGLSEEAGLTPSLHIPLTHFRPSWFEWLCQYEPCRLKGSGSDQSTEECTDQPEKLRRVCRIAHHSTVGSASGPRVPMQNDEAFPERIHCCLLVMVLLLPTYSQHVAAVERGGAFGFAWDQHGKSELSA